MSSRWSVERTADAHVHDHDFEVKSQKPENSIVAYGTWEGKVSA